MRTSTRLFRVAGAVALLIGLLAVMVAPVSAQQGEPSGPAEDMPFETGSPEFRAGVNTIYYPWVANDDDFGLGAADTSISVQNLEDRDAQIWIYVGDGGGGFAQVTTAFLSAYASKTFTAEMLGIAEGEGHPVAVSAYHRLDGVDAIDAIETLVTLTKPPSVVGTEAQLDFCAVNEVVTESDTGVTFASPSPFVAAVDFTFGGQTYEAYNPDDPDQVPEDYLVEWETTEELQAILNAVNPGAEGDDNQLIDPFGGLNSDGDCLDRAVVVAGQGSFLDSVAIGGVAKAAVNGSTLPYTSTEDTAVSGYNALSGWEIFSFDQWYLPIVQTNCGPGGCWDSTLRVANVGALNNAVTVRFFPADDGSGSLRTGFQVQTLINGGDTWVINLSDYVPDGWVGSAHIFSDGAVFAMVDRYKVGYNMWLTNTGSSADFEAGIDAPDDEGAQIPGANGRYALFAPHVLIDYFGWNTGINVANLVDEDNNVSIQYFNLFGNATEGANQRLAPHGMTYFYDPSQAPQDANEQDQDGDADNGDVTPPVDDGDETPPADDGSETQQANEQGDANANIVGSAIIWSDFPVAAVVDATKYPESDPNGGPDVFQGTSYSATQNIYTFQAVPLVMKGNPINGMGATSGINIMNPNSESATANVYWVNQSGFGADNFGTSSVSIPGFANGFVYTLGQHNLPDGFYGAAQVIASVPVAAVSANVDYQVDGDGSVIFNAYNPCGFFRAVQGDPDLVDSEGEPITTPFCSFGSPFEQGGQSVTKTFVDLAGDPIQGVGFSIVGTNPAFPFQRDGFSGTDGSLTFTNVPVGEYDLFVTAVPDGFVLPDPTIPVESFTVVEGEDVDLTNILQFSQGFTKTVIVSGTGTDADEDGVIDPGTATTLSGVDVAVYEVIGEDPFGLPVVGDAVFTGQTNFEGMVGASLAAGDYTLCIFDADGVATASTGETVDPFLPEAADVPAGCEEFTVETDIVTELTNEVFIVEDGFITTFFEGFEDGNADGWSTVFNNLDFGAIEVVPSGTDGIESSTGDFHAIFEGGDVSGPITSFDGPRSEWPEGGFMTSVDVYLDTDITNWPAGTGFQYEVGVNDETGTYLQGFVFHVTRDSSSGTLLVAANNNANGVPREDLETVPDNVSVTESGWYTFQQVFRDEGGLLVVDMIVTDSEGDEVMNVTLDTIHAIATDVGGNADGRFVVINVPGGIAVDNTQLQIAAVDPTVTP